MTVAGVRPLRHGRRERGREPLQHRRVEQEALERPRAGRPAPRRPGSRSGRPAVRDVGRPHRVPAGPGRQQQPPTHPSVRWWSSPISVSSNSPGASSSSSAASEKLKASSPSSMTVAPPAAAREVGMLRSRRPVIARCTLGGRSDASRPSVSRTGPGSSAWTSSRASTKSSGIVTRLVGEGGHLVVRASRPAAGPSPRPETPPPCRPRRGPAASRAVRSRGSQDTQTHGSGRALQRLDQQGGLAVAGPGDERQHAALQAAVARATERRAGHAVGRQPRRQQPRAQHAGRSVADGAPSGTVVVMVLGHLGGRSSHPGGREEPSNFCRNRGSRNVSSAVSPP